MDSPHKGISHAESVSMLQLLNEIFHLTGLSTVLSTYWAAASPHNPSPMRRSSPEILFPKGKMNIFTEKTSIIMMPTLSSVEAPEVIGDNNHCYRQSWRHEDSRFSLLNAKFLVENGVNFNDAKFLKTKIPVAPLVD